MSPERGILRGAALLLLLAFVQLCAGCRTTARSERGAVAPSLRFQTLTLGLCEDYPKSSRSLEHARQDLEICRASGAKVLRIAFSWLDMEPTPGTYDFSFWDDFVRMAVDEYHVRLIPYVCYTPRWAAADQGDDYWHAPPRDPQDFGRFVAALVARYHTRIHSWELWNEPDNAAYWTGSVAQFADLVLAGSHAVRAGDPGALVVVGGIAWRADFVAALLQNPAVAAAVDVINMHAYDETWSSDAIEELPAAIRRVHEIIAQHGGRQRLWLAEVGYSDFRGAGGYVSAQYTAHFPFEHTAAYQGDALLRCVVLAASTGDVDVVAWYRINDLGGGVSVIGDENNRHLGVVDVAGNSKPALAAFARAAQLFARPVACLDSEVRVAPAGTAGLQVHAFAQAGGDTDIFSWRPISSLSARPEGASFERASAPAALTVSVILPGGAVAKSCRCNAANCVEIHPADDRTECDHLGAPLLLSDRAER